MATVIQTAPLQTYPEIGEPTYDLAEPRASAMIHSLRAFGYDLSTALADLIDNSITAAAKNVWIEFFWNGEDSFISVTDDGRGMSEAELLEAMRPGSKSPLEKRNPKDLGRFGLGLKTASFSQAKRLTVATKQANSFVVRCWDLDYVTKCGDWRLMRNGSVTFEQHSQQHLAKLRAGTVVFWEAMDRITPGGTAVNSAKAQDQFYQKVDQVRAHAAMVFHRFLDAAENVGKTPLKLWINGESIVAWDPFMTNEQATQLLTEEDVPLLGNRLTVKPYILPHHSKISKENHKLASGPKGWNAQQGFYVYRNRRLLVAGSWLGLGFQQEEHYHLARILIDIPNHMDADWELDVKKSPAWPPLAIKDQLKSLAGATRSKASAVYRHGAARNKRRQQETGDTPIRGRPYIEIRGSLEETYQCLLNAGVNSTYAIFRLLNMEPFSLVPALVLALEKQDEAF